MIEECKDQTCACMDRMDLGAGQGSPMGIATSHG